MAPRGRVGVQERRIFHERHQPPGRGRIVSLQRSDLAASIYGTIQETVETIFGDSAVAIEEKVELAAAGGNHETAFTRYQERMMSFVRRKQDTAQNLASSFAPEIELRILLRDLATRLMVIPFVADALIGRDLRDDIRLPEYEHLTPRPRQD